MDQSESGQGGELVEVYRAPDQISAEMVKSYLDDERIPAIIESRQIPWYDGIMKAAEGFWGTIMVPEEYAERARQVVQVFLDGVEQQNE